VGVDGLLIPFVARTARRVPVFGRLLGIVQYLWRLPDLARNHELLESAVFENRNDLRRRIDAIVTEIEHAMAASRAAQASDASKSEARIREVQMQALDFRAAAQARSEKLAAALDEARARVERELGALHAQLADVRATGAALAVRVDSLAADVVKGARSLDALRDGQQDIGQRLAQLAAVSDFASRVASVERAMVDLDRLASATPHHDGEAAIAVPEGFYVAFEDRFRGARSDVKARTVIYLPRVRDAGAGSVQAPILDIGCGRGEWLELLQEQGLQARGVDVNDIAVAGCRSRGLDVSTGDAIEHLRQLAPDSLGAVSAMHVIEHLPFARVLELFDEAHRVLRPGGIAIFETPNPENLVVGACSFYYDPTHQRPLPPEPFRFILESRGFARVDILRLHPDESVPDLGTLPDALAAIIGQRLFGPRDYALIGVKDDGVSKQPAASERDRHDVSTGNAVEASDAKPAADTVPVPDEPDQPAAAAESPAGHDLFTRKALEASLAQRTAGAVHDPDYLGLLVACTAPTPVVLDVGANRGQSIVSLKAVFPHAIVDAFEPNPQFRPCLEALAAVYGESVRIHPYGLGRVEGRQRFYVPAAGDDVYTEEGSTRLDQFAKQWIVDRFRERGDVRLEESLVDIRRGDALQLSPDIVKIDVEGAEIDVLVGLEDTIRRSHALLLVENNDWDAVTPFLAELGYEPFRWSPERRRLDPYAGESTNAFYLHRSRRPA
jgi:FkbM family methyltransferase